VDHADEAYMNSVTTGSSDLCRLLHIPQPQTDTRKNGTEVRKGNSKTIISTQVFSSNLCCHVSHLIMLLWCPAAEQLDVDDDDDDKALNDDKI
jgi:hypothetical protein